MSRPHRSKLLAACAATALLVAACGDDDDDGEAADTTPAATAGTAATSAPATAATATTVADATTSPASTAAETTASPDTTSAPEAATGEPIKIGILTSITSNFAPWGLQVRDGAQLAVDDINAAGGVDGRPLELVIEDDQNAAEEAVPAYERLLEEGVVAVGGIISSTVGGATAPLAETNQMPTFLVKSGDERILTPDSRYTFRTCLPAAPSVAGPIIEYAQQNGLTKLGAIVADYPWGHAFQGSIETAVADAEGIELHLETAPVQEQDFTTYLRAIADFGPDLLVGTGHPPGGGPIIAQSNDLGMNVPVIGAYSPWALVMGGAGDIAIGRYADFDCADYQSDEYQEMARRFLEMSTDNDFMDDDAVAAYGIVTMIAQAVTEVGEDPVAIGEWLHTQEFDLPGYPFTLSWTEWGEMAAAQPLFSIVGEGPAPEGVNEAGDWYPETLLLPTPLTPYDPAAG
ncbi:MAG TPA: ABC transporter substrate-binding protein [Ilumatobacter sp.]|jgi:branched-chain amino acid transport system substrate-binding protein|nr:ABC transporter substrate-binding protein [Ilumatobacter sp.]